MSAAPPDAVLRSTEGDVLVLDVDSWRRDADELEMGLLESLTAPVIDVGCGPGRIVEALASSGRMAMGVDTSPAASAEASRRGAPVLTRSIFDPLPGERRWGSVIMLDGNIGIGGDPDALLRRSRELLAPGGCVVAEVGAPGSPTDRLTVRVERGGHHGPWFPWARVSADHIDELFTAAGLEPDAVERHGHRWFARARCVAPPRSLN